MQLKALRLSMLLLVSVTCHAQVMQQFIGNASFQTSAGPITLDTSCSGTTNNTINQTACSSPMTVTAGDAITCEASTQGFDPLSIYFGDSVNGSYDNVQAIIHPSSADTWVATAVFANSAGGSILPTAYSYEPANTNIQCQAWKGVPASQIVDGGAVIQTHAATTAAANPTSGTAAAPTNANEVVIGSLTRPAAATTSSGTGWTPSGTLTAIASNYAQYLEYQIQTAATAVNAPFTSASVKYTDLQFAVLNAANPSGYKSLSGWYYPAIAKTNGATITAADLNGATTTLISVNPNGGWALSGTAGTYSTAVAPTGTRKILVNGVPHTFGDSGTSMEFPSSLGAGTSYTLGSRDYNWGTAAWMSSFIQVASSGTTSGAFCDLMWIQGGVSDTVMNLQVQWDTGGGFGFILEPFESGSSVRLVAGALDTDVRAAFNIGSVNDRYHQLHVYTKSGSTWSQAGSLNYDMLCANSGTNLCSTPTPAESTTGVASSGSTTLVVTSATGITQGQIILGTGIPDPSQSGEAWTTVESITGTTVTLSQNTSAAVSGTVTFYGALSNLITATNGTASSGSTTLTVVAPSYGTIAAGDAVGGVGITPGTFVSAVTGTAVTLSQPTTAALSSTGISIWAVNGQVGAKFGRYSSCTQTGNLWLSGIVVDPLNTWGAFAPN